MPWLYQSRWPDFALLQFRCAIICKVGQVLAAQTSRLVSLGRGNPKILCVCLGSVFSSVSYTRGMRYTTFQYGLRNVPHQQNSPTFLHAFRIFSFRFDVTAQQLLMDVRNEAMARAHWLELGEWPSEELTGGPTVRGLIPDAVLGLGQTRFWENLVRISTLHHVLCHALRCLKMGARELHIPDTITAETVEQAREFMEKTSMAKALVTEVSLQQPHWYFKDSFSGGGGGGVSR